MKWMIWVIGVVVILAILYVMGRKSVHHEIVIYGTPKQVWNVLSDTDKYKEWNPTMLVKEGTLQQGSTLTYIYVQDENTQSELKAVVKEIIPNQMLNQYGGMPVVLTFNHKYTLFQEGDMTRVIIHEDYRGIGVNFWNPNPVELSYERLNKALKKRVESLN